MLDWHQVYQRLRERIEAFGVAVRAERLGVETTGIFDGLSITCNVAYDLETCCYNLAHSLGHIAQWSLDRPRQQALYEDLARAKANRGSDPAGLARALTHFRAYEEQASEYAAWLLEETGNADVVPTFTNFARADIEVIVGYHRDGIAPVWRDFFASWNAEVARGARTLQPFLSRPIPPFQPIAIEPQEVIQEVDGQV